MSEVRPTIAALRAWLKSCPLIAEEQEATGAAFRIAGLDEDATAFSIEDSPGHHLPALEAPRQPLGVSVTSTGYIVTSSAGSCRMQMQLRLTYYQPK